MMFTVTVRLKDGGFEGEKKYFCLNSLQRYRPPSLSLHSGSYLQHIQKFPHSVMGFWMSGLLLLKVET